MASGTPNFAYDNLFYNDKINIKFGKFTFHGKRNLNKYTYTVKDKKIILNHEDKTITFIKNNKEIECCKEELKLLNENQYNKIIMGIIFKKFFFNKDI